MLIWIMLAVTVWTQWDQPSMPGVGLSANPGQQKAAADTRTYRLQQFNTEGLLAPPSRLLSGGPAKDGIPSLTNPDTIPIDQADFLKDQSRVIGVTIDGQSRAYPIGVLNWHEIINDRLGTEQAIDIAVIYCPLCDSASVVDRKLNGRTYEFGISGLLYNSNVVFFDRTDQALWSQVGLRALSGPNRGQSLTHLAGWEVTTIGDWKDKHPDSTVVTFKTGYKRVYGRNPYSRYFTHDQVNFPLDLKDSRYKNKERVIGILYGNKVRAYPIAMIKNTTQGEIHDQINAEPIHLRVDPKTNAIRVVNMPDGAKAVHTFWFAWIAFHPDTDIYTPSQQTIGHRVK